MADVDPVPSVGSQVARYSFIREIARGPLGTLYECRKDGLEGTCELLARVVALPAGLPAIDEKQFEDAAWDSAATAHELTVRVADVVFGKGWFTLVHDSTDGILLSLLEDKATALHLTFPPDVAVRIVLDVLEGLELSKEQCDAAQLNWRTGSVSPHSLALCRDGRTRALDGQVAATAIRLLASNERAPNAIPVPPEVLADPSGVSDRIDVFMVGSLLWGLLTGRSLDLKRDFEDGFADISRAVPEQVNLSKGLCQAIGQSLKAVPEQRQGSLRELTVALVMGTEKVATYPEVLDFVDALLLLDSSRTVPGEAIESSSSAANERVKTRLSMISWADDGAPPSDARALAEGSPAVSVNANSVVADASPLPDAGKDAVEVQPAVSVEAAHEALVDEGPPRREQQNTLPGTGTITTTDVVAGEGAGSKAKGSEAPSIAQVSSPEATVKGHSKPLVTRAALTSNRPPKTDSPSGESRSIRPPPSDAVKEVLLALEKKSASKAPSFEPMDAAVTAPSKERKLQISMSTLVLGFSTTVLAVVVVMLLLMRSQPNSVSEPKPTVSPERIESKREPEPPAVRADVPSRVSEPKPNQQESSVTTSQVVTQVPPSGAKAAAKPQATKANSSAVNKANPSGNETTDGARAAEQKHPKHYVPNDL